ncbi:hypothetical protein C5C40_09535 [Rathayibacter rathayi]|uniref:Uncharacterized protein n=1 Tax=Rathayibacter rathayi TaxID=33887 RepID=A0ABX5AD56_RATRA|nr:hypothetical protein C5C40_09535 [Rathayibacter rathayi]
METPAPWLAALRPPHGRMGRDDLHTSSARPAPRRRRAHRQPRHAHDLHPRDRRRPRRPGERRNPDRVQHGPLRRVPARAGAAGAPRAWRLGPGAHRLRLREGCGLVHRRLPRHLGADRR